jgi:alpha-glucosidase
MLKHLYQSFLSGAAVLAVASAAAASENATSIESPDGRNSIVLEGANSDGEFVRYTVRRDCRTLIGPSKCGPDVQGDGTLGKGARVVSVETGRLDESFELPWGKARSVVNRCATALVTLSTPSKGKWQIELRAYDGGVAYRYRVLTQAGSREFVIRDELAEFVIEEAPTALFNVLESFTTSHESVYQRMPVADIPSDKLVEMPLLLMWSNGPAAAITEARVRNFAGMLLQREAGRPSTLRGRLAPLPGRRDACVVGVAPHESPWRVVLLADEAGKLLESNLLIALNDAPPKALGDLSWIRPGKTTFHWWNGEFEADYLREKGDSTFLDRHKRYIDFCAKYGIAYHAVSGDGRAWYQQSSTDYGTPSPDADVRQPRPELRLPEILAYARQRGVGIRLWVHWKPLSEHLEEALALYESWGVTGLMVDFLDRDDQEMNDFTERMLACAARHHLLIQIHGSPKPSGEQRTFPNLVNREGVMNLEYLKWGDQVTPDHNVNVAYTRALAGPLDYHLGGFRSVPRSEFQPRNKAPVVLGTRCHHLALYVVYENPLPMVADEPSAYEGQPGFEFIAGVPTTWNETRFVAGEPGEYVVVARRSGNVWYLGGITNWAAREIDIPLAFLGAEEYEAELYVDGSLDDAEPNATRQVRRTVDSKSKLHLSLAPGGGFVGVLRPK